MSSRKPKIPIVTAIMIDNDDMMSNDGDDDDVNNNNTSDCWNNNNDFYNNNEDKSNDKNNDNETLSPTIINSPSSPKNSQKITNPKITSENSSTNNKIPFKVKKSVANNSSTPKYSVKNVASSNNKIIEDTSCPYPHSIFHLTNEEKAREYLRSNGVPSGIEEKFVRTLKEVPLRYFILDDSGSMSTNDGRVIVNDGFGRKRIISCSRWTELVESMKFHINLAKSASAPSEFRFINLDKKFLIGVDNNNNNDEIDNKVNKDNNEIIYYELLLELEKSVRGKTPLCKHIYDIAFLITKMKTELIENGQKVCIIIATDGQPTDGDLFEAMKLLLDLPVWIVVRLCTNEQSIIDLWNRIDEDLELNIDVIDDYTDEAVSIKKYNSWLTYGESLHRLREFGCIMSELDHIDESKLSAEEVIKICHLIFGGESSDYPHPQKDLKTLSQILHKCNDKNGKVWDSTKGSEQYWVNVGKIASKYGHQSRCSIM